MKRILTKIGLVLVSIVIGLSPLLVMMPVKASVGSVPASSIIMLSESGVSQQPHYSDVYNDIIPGSTVALSDMTPVTSHALVYYQYYGWDGLRKFFIGFDVGDLDMDDISQASITANVVVKTANEWPLLQYGFCDFPRDDPENITEYDWNSDLTLVSDTVTFTDMPSVNSTVTFDIGTIGLSYIVPDVNNYIWLAFVDYFAFNGDADDPTDENHSQTLTLNDFRFNFVTSSPPTVETEAATDETTIGATLHGNLTDMGDYAGVRTEFFYGLTTDYGYYEVANANQTSIGTFSAVITDAVANSTYHYKAVATGNGGGLQDSGDDMTFDTLPASALPTVTTGLVGNITNTSALAQGIVTSLGNQTEVFATFRRSTHSDMSYAVTDSAHIMNATGNYSQAFTYLTPNTTYYYQAILLSNGTYAPPVTLASGSICSFTTASVTNMPPVISAVFAGQITNSTAELKATISDLGSAPAVQVRFEYGLTPAYENGSVYNSFGNLVTTGTAIAVIGNLTDNTTYHFRAIAVGDGTTVSPDASFNTGFIEILPIIFILSPTNIADTNATFNGMVLDNGTATDIDFSFDYRISGSPSFNTVSTEEYDPATGIFSYNITGLTPDTIWEVRANGWTEQNGGVYIRSGFMPFYMTKTAALPGIYVDLYPASFITETSAIFSASVYGENVTNTTQTIAYFSYSNVATGASFSTSPTTVTGPGSFGIRVDSLTPGTNYSFLVAGTANAQGFSKGNLYFTTLGTAPPATTPPATTLPGGGRGNIGPFDLPDDWVSSGTSYVWLIILLVALPVICIFFAGIKIGAPIGGIVDIAVLAYWMESDWVDLWVIGLVITLVALLFYDKIKRAVFG